MFFLSILLPYAALASAVSPPLLGSETLDLDGRPLNNNSVAADVRMEMVHHVPSEQSHALHEESHEFYPIEIPGEENMEPELVQELKSLYTRAREDNLSLDADERYAFLHREDVFGLAVALPSLLTEDQGFWILRRPPPKIVNQAIRDEFNLNSIAEVAKYVTENADKMTDRQYRLILRDFHPIEDNPSHSGRDLAALSSPPCHCTSGVFQAARGTLHQIEGTFSLVKKAVQIRMDPERRRARREKTLREMREFDRMSSEEQQARFREREEAREAGAAAREEMFAEIDRWGEASSKLSDGQLAEMRRLRELGPEAVQRHYLKSFGYSDEEIESVIDLYITDE